MLLQAVSPPPHDVLSCGSLLDKSHLSFPQCPQFYTSHHWGREGGYILGCRKSDIISLNLLTCMTSITRSTCPGGHARRSFLHTTQIFPNSQHTREKASVLVYLASWPRHALSSLDLTRFLGTTGAFQRHGVSLSSFSLRMMHLPHRALEKMNKRMYPT